MKTSRLITIILITATALGLMACVKKSYEPASPLQPSDPYAPHVKLNILVVGNSYSWDAFAYMPWIIHEVDPTVELTVGILCRGGCLLSQHYNEHILQEKEYPYYHKSVNFGSWASQPATTISQALADTEWDLIVLQQGSSKSFDYTTYSYIADIQEWINTTLGRKPDYAWLMTPAYPDGSDRLPGTPGVTIVTGMNSSEEMHNGIAYCAEHAMADYDFCLLLPVGTAIQNARQIPQLDILGNFNGANGYGHLTADGIHLQDGIPRLVANYVTAGAILRHYCKKSIDNSYIAIDNSFRAYQQDLTMGNIAGMNEENRALAKQAVNAAFVKPYAITR